MQDLVAPASVIVVQRNLIFTEVWEAISYWRMMRKVVVADLDDDYPHLPASNPAHEFWIKNANNLPEAPIALLTKGLAKCDALTSPNKVILSDWKDTVAGVWVPNYARGEWYLNLHKRPKDDRIIIGWGGSVSHSDSWFFSGAKEAVETICRENPKVCLMLCGNDPRLAGMFDIPKEQKFIQQGVPPKDWPKVVSQFDIGVAPLDLKDGEASYDQRRSWIKCLEYLLCGVPWVASKSHPYEDFEQWGKCVENTSEAWTTALRDTVANLDVLKRQAHRNRKIGWENTLESKIDLLMETYERITLAAMPQLPQTYYVHWTSDGKSLRERQEKARQEISKAILPAQPARAVLDNVQLAATMASRRLLPQIDWYGVDLAENMAYDLTQRFNRFLLETK